MVARLFRDPGRVLRRAFFSIADRETTFAHRGFDRTDGDRCNRLEAIGATFLRGYRAAMQSTPRDDHRALASELDRVSSSHRGWAYEGAGMALALRDRFAIFGRGRLDTFLAGPAAAHTYLVHVGAGWVAARLKLDLPRYLDRFDPVLRWLAVDGFGFHQGYFHAERTVENDREILGVPQRGYYRHAHDQGLGRSLFFVRGGDPARIVATVRSFPADRQPDLISGVGLAAAYAGGLSRDELVFLANEVGEHRAWFAQGVAFAAKARSLADNLTADAELACEVICGRNAAAVASLADRTLEESARDAITEEVPHYEWWRRRLADAADVTHFPHLSTTDPSLASPKRGAIR